MALRGRNSQRTEIEREAPNPPSRTLLATADVPGTLSLKEAAQKAKAAGLVYRKSGAVHATLRNGHAGHRRVLMKIERSSCGQLSRCSFVALSTDKGDAMRKSLTALAAATTLAVAAVATPTTADARWGWWGPAFGGFAAGAIIGSALARPYYAYPYYGYGYGYGPYYGYGYPAYYYAPRPYYGYYGRRYYARRYWRY
jgi:hypothetical protein